VPDAGYPALGALLALPLSAGRSLPTVTMLSVTRPLHYIASVSLESFQVHAALIVNYSELFV
jgi:hypothetical protein